MKGPFDICRAKHPKLWEVCLRAFDPEDIYGATYLATGEQSTYPDFASGKNGASFWDTVTAAAIIKPAVKKGVTSTNHTGSASGYITFPDTGLPSGAADYSVSIWCHATQIFSGNGVLISYGDLRSGGAAAYYKGVNIGVDSSGLYCGIYNSNVSYVPWSVIADKWVHVCYTQKGTTAKCYINGELYLSGTITTPNITLWGTGYIGAMNDVGVKYPFSGYIGTSAIYGRTLSDDEVRLLASDQQVMFHENDPPSGSAQGNRCCCSVCCPPGTCHASVFLTIISSGAKCACLVGEVIELVQSEGCSQSWNTVSETIKTCDDVALMGISITVTCVVIDGVQQWLMNVHSWDRCTLVGTNPPSGGCTPPSDACTISTNGACPPSGTFCFTFSGLDCCNVFNSGESVCFELSI